MASQNLPRTYPMDVIANHFGLTPRRLLELAAKGVISRTGHGEYELAGSERGYARYLQGQGVQARNGGFDVAAERARLVKLQANVAELQVQQRRGRSSPLMGSSGHA